MRKTIAGWLIRVARKIEPVSRVTETRTFGGQTILVAGNASGAQAGRDLARRFRTDATPVALQLDSIPT